ncbi:MAG: hypothetical protein RSB77_06260 [Bacilli bacterium]
MKTKEEIKDWLLENCIDEDGDLILMNLDFSDFDKNIYISNMKVKGNLLQYNQKVQGDLWQSCQEVQGKLLQYSQKVEGDLYQYGQKVKREFITQTLKEDEEYKTNEYGYTYIVKKV